MNRIDFFKNLFLGGTSLFVAKHLTVAAPKEIKDIYLNSPHIAGFQYYNGEEIEKNLKENDKLTLKREPQNRTIILPWKYSATMQNSATCPRSDNKLIARMMDQGLPLKAQIRHIDTDAHPYRRVKMGVYYEMG